MSQLKKFKVGDALPQDDWGRNIERALDDFLSQVTLIVNKGIRFADNFDAQMVSVTTAAADTEVTVAHTLKRVPTGYLVYSRDKGGTVYDSGTAFTSSNIYIKCTTATTVLKLLIF